MLRSVKKMLLFQAEPANAPVQSYVSNRFYSKLNF